MNNDLTKKEIMIDKSLEERASMRELEQFYTEGQIDNLQENIEREKEKLVNEMIEYAKDKIEEVKWDRDGNPIAYEVKHNPKVISYKFFKPIIKLNGIEPRYNAEQLGMLYNYYCFLVAEVNDKIGDYPSSLNGFCKFIGLTLTTFRKYKFSEDPSMRIVVEKIYDEVEEDNFSMAQMGLIKEKTTQTKMQVQNEVVIKTTPKINININEKPDLKSITDRINKYIDFVDTEEANVK